MKKLQKFNDFNKTNEKYFDEVSIYTDIIKEFGNAPKGADIRIKNDDTVQIYFYSPNKEAKEWVNKIKTKFGEKNPYIDYTDITMTITESKEYILGAKEEIENIFLGNDGKMTKILAKKLWEENDLLKKYDIEIFNRAWDELIDNEIIETKDGVEFCWCDMVEDTVNENRTYTFNEVIKNKHANDNKEKNEIKDFKKGQYVIGSKFYGSKDEFDEELCIVTDTDKYYVMCKSVKGGEEKKYEPQDLIILTGMGATDVVNESISKEDEEKYLTPKQRKLPEGLKKAIINRAKKTKKTKKVVNESISKEDEEKYLTPKQRKLPEGLKKSIIKSKKQLKGKKKEEKVNELFGFSKKEKEQKLLNKDIELAKDEIMECRIGATAFGQPGPDTAKGNKELMNARLNLLKHDMPTVYKLLPELFNLNQGYVNARYKLDDDTEIRGYIPAEWDFIYDNRKGYIEMYDGQEELIRKIENIKINESYQNKGQEKLADVVKMYLSDDEIDLICKEYNVKKDTAIDVLNKVLGFKAKYITKLIDNGDVDDNYVIKYICSLS